MASVLQNVKATMAWQKHQLLADFDENDSPVPDKFKRRAALSSLNTIRMSLRKRAPLKRVELNCHKTPTRESLEARQRCQTLQNIKRTAKNAFGTVSQKIQRSCQSPVRSMRTFPAKSISRSSTKKKTATPQSPCYKTVIPAASSKDTPTSSKRALLGPTRVSGHREWRDLSSWLGKNAVSLRRSKRAAALRSPYSSPASARKIDEKGQSQKLNPSLLNLNPVCELQDSCLGDEWRCEAVGQWKEFDCELELVSSGICQLKRISQALDDAIVNEERQQTISNYYYLMAKNFQSARRSLKPSQALRRQARKLHQALGT